MVRHLFRYRRFLASLAAVGIASFGVMFTPTVTPAAAADCPKYEFIGARGSDEKADDYGPDRKYGMGDVVGKVYTDLAAAFPAGEIVPYGVHYPAVTTWNGYKDIGAALNGAGALLHFSVVGAYHDSVREGTDDTVAHIRQKRALCGDQTKFILAGYSQGAQAVGDALQKKLSPQELASVAAAVFFGDPYFNATSWSGRSDFDPNRYGLLGVRPEWPSGLHGKVLSYCRLHDWICNVSKKYHLPGVDIYVRDYRTAINDQHSRYVAGGDAADAAAQLALLLNAPHRPPTGTAPLDLVFVIDSTGSMGPYIDGVKANVTALVQTIASTSTDFRLALADYKDDLGNNSDYQARLDVGFTTSATAFAQALQPVTAFGGGDDPESVYSGVMTGLNLPWRDGVKKALIVIGDASAKDPEPGTGYTMAQVRAKALAVDPAQVYSVIVGTDPEALTSLTELAERTGGLAIVAPDTGTFVTSLKSAIVAAGTAPQAALSSATYTGSTGEPVTFSAAATRDPGELIAGYDWDFNGDGTYDRSTQDPVTSNVYGAPGSYQLVVRARSASGLAGTAAAQVRITNPVAGPPGKPTNLAAAPGDTVATLSWKPGSSPHPLYYSVYDGAGKLIDQFAAPDGDDQVRWRDLRLTNGTTYTYKVSAGNEHGESPQQGPVEVTPQATGENPDPSTSPSPSPSLSPSVGTPSSGTGNLPRTGSRTIVYLWAGGALLVAGLLILMMLTVRRRRRLDGI